MARSQSGRMATLAIANLLLPIAVLIFATGFFPYKPVLPGLAEFEQRTDDIPPEAVFKRVVFMVVDALRSDFVYGHESGFDFTQSLIRSGAAIPFTAHATPPTVTMPRVKALTTGSVPSFLDLILNFAESDTSSSLAAQDTWLAQIRAKGGKIVFYGDDTWLKLFPDPDFFHRHDGTSSFFVSDFTEVDYNVTRHVPDELGKSDWNAMIMHYLGLDHIGHKTGPQGPNMLPKQKEMDGIVKMIFEAMENEEHQRDTLLVLAGDHGMNAGGNHGGSGPGETEPALLFASPKFRGIKKRREYECPTRPKEGTEFHYYTKVEQSDLVPTLAGLMGLPISRNSLGVSIPELSGVWDNKENLEHLQRNAEQMLQIIEATYGEDSFRAKSAEYKAHFALGITCDHGADDERLLACFWARVHSYAGGSGSSDGRAVDIAKFLLLAQELLSGTASSYDIPRMVEGMVLIATVIGFTLFSFPSLWPPSMAGMSLMLISILYGVMMFASSYVEEEQHFWYWLTPAWVMLCSIRNAPGPTSSRSTWKLAIATLAVLAVHRISIRWNQTGQKHAGEPDIVHTFFPHAHIWMWFLILATFMYTGFLLFRRTFAGIMATEIAAAFAIFLVVPAIIFKLNFTQADAPELVQGLAHQIRMWTEQTDLVSQARIAFSVLAVATAVVVILSMLSAKESKASAMREIGLLPTLSERLHYLLTLFLILQSRAPNVPLFLGMEIQREALSYIFDTSDDDEAASSANRVTQLATTTLLLSHVYFFCTGGSNSISSIDLSNAYNGVADYNILAVGVLLFASNWTGPIWWCSAANQLLSNRPRPHDEDVKMQLNGKRSWIEEERMKLRKDAVLARAEFQKSSVVTASNTNASNPWLSYMCCMTAFISTSLLAVMAACTALRTHLFIWTVFSPKYLYAMAWSIGWHLLVNIGFGSLLRKASGVS